ncbi:MAG: molybdopterin-guanine dinucleotide biosynthesis protein B [Firmicutes bacterium HGW-Firmicutes-11]|jgi:molybdopterin-guanine dinucleotide biosynthesis protein B|nr:MAG: molybdopterin-guanine dinucleotide biosynthesis protein B [Firmicutes bacterium HGW-Firmicutes-11]
MAYVFSVVGSNSNVGKTTLIVEIIKDLKARGYRVSTIKHDSHDYEIDKEGKDTWRHRKAGAGTVIISSRSMYTMIRETNEDTPVEQLVALIDDSSDFIVIEGYKGSGYPKIEVYRKEASERQLHRDGTFIAIASNVPDLVADDLPVLDINEPAGIVDFLIKMKQKG